MWQSVAQPRIEIAISDTDPASELIRQSEKRNDPQYQDTPLLCATGSCDHSSKKLP
jgi:hypothetical protein